MILKDIGKFGTVVVDPVKALFAPLKKTCTDYTLVPHCAGGSFKGYIVDSASKAKGVSPYWAHQLLASARARDATSIPEVMTKIQEARKQTSPPPPPPANQPEGFEEEDEEERDDAIEDEVEEDQDQKEEEDGQEQTEKVEGEEKPEHSPTGPTEDQEQLEAPEFPEENRDGIAEAGQRFAKFEKCWI